jgi:two-component system response regulator LytT
MNEQKSVLIVEDESIIAEELRRITTQLGYQVIAVTHRYVEAIKVLEQQVPDIVLLDIGLDYSENDGIDLATHINEYYKIPFIYITANADLRTVNRAKVTKPAAYITKPFNRDLIYTNIEIALHKCLQHQNQGHITVKQGLKKITVNFNEIVFLKADNMYTEIHTNTNNIYIVRKYLKSFLDNISQSFVVQIHRSYAVNLNFVQSYTSEFVFVNNQKLPVSNLYKKNLH